MGFKILAIGTGRDGTTTLTTLVQHIYQNHGQSLKSVHEWKGLEGYNALCNYYETQDSHYLDILEQIIERWDIEVDAICGNGYAFYLTEILRHYGSHLKIIHLKRQDRQACVNSLVKNAKLFPHYHGYYSDLNPRECHLKRLTAFHLGEMSQKAWQALTPQEKFAWYYDKTHQIMTDTCQGKSNYHLLHTEDLNQPQSLEQLSVFLSKDFNKPAKPLRHNTYNRYFDLAKLPLVYRLKAQWYFEKFDLHKHTNPLYPLQYFGHLSLSFLKLSFGIIPATPSPIYQQWLIRNLKQIKWLLTLTNRALEQNAPASPITLPTAPNLDYFALKETSLPEQSYLNYLYQDFNLLTLCLRESYAIHYFCQKIYVYLKEHPTLFTNRKEALKIVLDSLLEKVDYLLFSQNIQSFSAQLEEWPYPLLPIVVYNTQQGFHWIEVPI